MARQMDPRRPTHSLATSHFPFLTRSLSEGITMASHRTLAQVIKEFSAISGSQADTNWAGRAAFQLLDTHHIKESAARDALEEALTTFTAASTDTSTPLATNDEQWLRELGETLRARGDMSDRKVRRIEADARTFVADSGNTLMRNLVRLPHTHTASGARQQGMHAPWHTTLAWWRWWACSRCSPTHRSARAQRFPPFSWAWPLSP